MTRKKLYRNYIILAIVFTALAIATTVIFEKFILTEEEAKTGSSNPISAILGVLGAFLFFQTFIIGVPSYQRWLRNRKGISRSQILKLHCDLATTATITIILHVIFGSLLTKYEGIFYWYSIYPWFYEGFTESWSNLALSLTYGSWALFFMIIATIAGYYKKWLYKHYSRSTFIFIQNLTIISLVTIAFHILNIGTITTKNIVLYYLTIIISVIFGLFWLYYNIKMIKTKSSKKRNRSPSAIPG